MLYTLRSTWLFCDTLEMGNYSYRQQKATKSDARFIDFSFLMPWGAYTSVCVADCGWMDLRSCWGITCTWMCPETLLYSFNTFNHTRGSSSWRRQSSDCASVSLFGCSIYRLPFGGCGMYSYIGCFGIRPLWVRLWSG